MGFRGEHLLAFFTILGQFFYTVLGQRKNILVFFAFEICVAIFYTVQYFIYKTSVYK